MKKVPFSVEFVDGSRSHSAKVTCPSKLATQPLEATLRPLLEQLNASTKRGRWSLEAVRVELNGEEIVAIALVH